MIINVKPVGTEVPRIDKGSKESILYTLNYKELLDPKELISSASAEGFSLDISEVQVRQGNTITLRIGPTNIFDTMTMQYLDTKLEVAYRTSLGNIRSTTVNVRIYK